MKRSRAVYAFLFVIVVFGTSRPVWAQGQPNSQKTPEQLWKKIPIPKLPEFHPAQPKRFELPNGMVIFFQEDHELPMIDGTARIRGGERSVSASKAGLTDIYEIGRASCRERV